MDYNTAIKRYQNDPEFHALVEVFYHQLLQNQFTIQEMKDALVFAGIKFESEYVSLLGFKYRCKIREG